MRIYSVYFRFRPQMPPPVEVRLDVLMLMLARAVAPPLQRDATGGRGLLNEQLHN